MPPLIRSATRSKRAVELCRTRRHRQRHGLQYFRARWYDPNLGRFISEDPIGLNGGINQYAYVGNNSLNATDPLGLWPDGYDGYGSYAADFWDKLIYDAINKGYDPWLVVGPSLTPVRLSSILLHFTDLLRVGNGLGQAMYANDENGWGRAAFVAMDVQRAADLFALIAGARAGRLGAPVEEFDACPLTLRRPYIRNSTRQAVLDSAPRGPNGEWIDANTRELFTENYHLGHKYGQEFWRMRNQAIENGLTQKHFNDLMNDPDLYQIERPINNWSHKYEKPR